MKKVFLFLYPIKEYTEMFLFNNEELYEKLNIKRPLPILNQCIQKRYRENGYEIYFATYPDKEIYGIEMQREDKVILTDVNFEEFSAVDLNGNIKENHIPKYPNEIHLISQIGEIDKIEELKVGGYHAFDCVKRVGEVALNLGIDTQVDLDLTDLFFSLYKDEEYFRIDDYDPKRYLQHLHEKASRYGEEYIDEFLEKTYNSSVYGLRRSYKEYNSEEIDDDFEW